MHKRLRHLMGALLITFSYTAIEARSGDNRLQIIDEKKAMQKLADRLVKNVQEDPDSVVAQFDDKGSSDVSQFDGTSYRSKMAYHDNKIPVCVAAGSFRCDQWFDEYHSEHAGGGDSSLLEDLIANNSTSLSMSSEERVEFGKQNLGSDKVEFGVWEIEVRDANQSMIVGVNDWRDPKRGTMDKRNIKDMRLKQDVTKQIEDLSKKTAEESILKTINPEDVQGAQTLTTPESLRLKAGSLTRALRNRLITNVGGARAGQGDIEFVVNDANPDCMAAMEAEKQQGPLVGGEQILYEMNRMEGEDGLKKRFERCQKAMSASYSEATHTLAQRPQDDSSVGGNGDKQVDIWKAKINIATIDYAGLEDPNALEKPGDVQIKKEDYTNKIVNYNNGASNFREIAMTNADQIDSYNEQLKKASSAMGDIAEKFDGIEDTSQKISDYKIKKGAMDLISLNGLTPAMIKDLEGTKVESLTIYDENKKVSTEEVDPNTFLEGSASELTTSIANK